MEDIAKMVEKAIVSLIPFLGDTFAGMTPDQKREFLIKLSEAVARGMAEGFARGARKE